jgi:hypothetical protein
VQRYAKQVLDPLKRVILHIVPKTKPSDGGATGDGQ